MMNSKSYNHGHDLVEGCVRSNVNGRDTGTSIITATLSVRSLASQPHTHTQKMSANLLSLMGEGGENYRFKNNNNE